MMIRLLLTQIYSQAYEFKPSVICEDIKHVYQFEDIIISRVFYFREKYRNMHKCRFFLSIHPLPLLIDHTSISKCLSHSLSVSHSFLMSYAFGACLVVMRVTVNISTENNWELHKAKSQFTNVQYFQFGDSRSLCRMVNFITFISVCSE